MPMKITNAEFESRRQVRALMDLFRDAYPEIPVSLQALPSENRNAGK